MADIVTRLWNTDDIPRIAELVTQWGYSSTVAKTEETLNRIQSRGYAAVFVALLNNEVVGWLYVAEHLVVAGDTFAEIHGMVTDEKFRRRGIGRALVKAAKDWTKQQGLNTLRVRTNVNRPESNIFYPKTGFSLLKQQNIYSVSL